ncbi:MAG: hypothetical protein ACWA41_09560 [Putridiphycobacter sp.]
MNKLKLFLGVFLCFITLNTFAQTPEKINYQAIVRDVQGIVVANQTVSVKIQITESLPFPSGTVIFEEEHAVTTNSYGLVNIKIGTGTAVTGTISSIDWGNNAHFLTSSIDPAGGTNYTLVGTSELVSVPYALHAKTVDDKDDEDADTLNEIQTLTLTGSDLTLSHNGGTISINDADSDATNELQTINQTANFVTLSDGGGTININDADSDATNEFQTVSQSGSTVTLSDGGGSFSIDDSDASATNEIQTVSQSGSTITLSNGGGSFSIDDSDADATNEFQTVSQSGSTVTLSDGGGSFSIDDSDASATNEIQTVSQSGSTVTLSNGGGSFSVDDADADATNEIQTISQSGSTVTLSNSGGSISIDDADADATNELIDSTKLIGTDLFIYDAGGAQSVDLSSLGGGVDPSISNELNDSIKLIGTDLFIYDAGGAQSVDLSSLGGGGDPSSTNELQTLSISGDQLTISSGNTVTIPVQTLHVGMHYQGGIIVFLDSTGQHGLIAATADVGTFAYQPSGNTNLTTAQSYIDGAANTAAIMGSGFASGSAAEACDTYAGGGFTDWYLPAYAEILYMFQNALVVQNLDLGAIYWTSTQTPGGFGFSAVSFYGTFTANSSTNPNTVYTVRPMRAF